MKKTKHPNARELGRRKRRRLVISGALIIFITFLVRETLRDYLRDLKESLAAGRPMSQPFPIFFAVDPASEAVSAGGARFSHLIRFWSFHFCEFSTRIVDNAVHK